MVSDLFFSPDLPSCVRFSRWSNMSPPTSQLPPIKAIRSSSIDILQNSVEYIKKLYIPPVRGSFRRNRRTNFANESTESLQLLHWDTFERDYAIRWLTALIRHFGSDDHNDQEEEAEQESRRENLIRSATSLLAICAGTASAGTLSRTFVFEICPARRDEQTCASRASSVVVELTDILLDNSDYRSVGAQTWGGACLMADMIAENPASFGVPDMSSPNSERPLSFRCIELGAGTGLVSLAIGKLLEHRYLPLSGSTGPTGKVEIVATDYYPAVLENLQKNVHNNFANDTPIQIRSQRLDWSIFSASTPISDPPVLQERFDVVYGADIIYESQHAQWVKGCLEKLLKKRSGDIDPAFHLIIPLRRTHIAESNTVELVFRTAMQIELQPPGERDREKLLIKHKEIITCDSENYSTEQVEYVYYKIGWGTYIQS